MPSKLDPHIAAIAGWLAEQPQLTAIAIAGSKITDKERFLCAAQSSGRHISIWQQTDQEFLAGSARRSFVR
jgi:hypothetical protein